MKRSVQPPLQDKKTPKARTRTRVSPRVTGGTTITVDVAPDDATKTTNEGNAREFLDQARRRWQLAADAESYNRIQGLLDVEMVDGDGQWDDDVRGRRQRKKRPCLTINRFIPMIAHVANEQRMSRPAIEVRAVGGGADPKDAEIRQGLIRHIEVTSNAETVYDTAFERMIEKGWSWYRIVTDWESPESFDQVIKIEGFTDDFAIYSDPTAIDPTRKDMKWCFIVYDMPRGEYMDLYPKSKAAGLNDWQSIGDTSPQWVTADSIRVCEYYYMDEIPVTLVKLTDGRGVYEDEIEERAGLYFSKADLEKYDNDEIQPEQVREIPVKRDENGQLVTRQSYRSQPKWCKINAVEILDGNAGDNPAENTAGRPIAGKYIPMVMVCGRERNIKGQRRLSGMVRNARDAQRMYNYMTSGFAEMVALAPKSPFIAAIGQIEEFKALWDNLNTENYPWLPYKPKDVGGQLVPPPVRQNQEPPVAAYIQGIALFDNILKIQFNIFDPSLGTAKSDQSGRAISGLQARSDAANLNWMDNMRRAQEYGGDIVLNMIPDIYDAPRAITIVRADKEEQVLINQEFKQPGGEVKNYDMATGKFSCTISLGQYASKRQATVASLTEIAKNVPQVSLALLPLILDNMDSPMAQDAAEIVKRMQPPALQEPGSPAAMQQQFQQLMQQHQLLVKAMDRANEMLRTKQLDLASKEYIAGLQAQAQIVAAALKAGSTESIQMAIQEYQRLNQLFDQNHERIMSEQQQAHELAMQEKDLAAAASQPQPAGATA